MDANQLNLMFHMAEEQARAVRTLFAFKCIKRPEYHEARSTALKHLREILSGAVPCYTTSGTLVFEEHRPECLSAFRTVLMQHNAYGALISNMIENTDEQISECIRALPATIQEHKHECEHCQPDPEPKAGTVLPATE